MEADAICDLLARVPKLEGSSGYLRFAPMMEDCLLGLGYGRLLPGGIHENMPAKQELEQDHDYFSRRGRWQDKQAMACATIRTRLGCGPGAAVTAVPATADEAAKFETVAEIWKELEKLYRPKGYRYYKSLLQEWELLDLSNCAGVAELASRLTHITEQLSYLGEELTKPEPEMIMKFHAALGPRYRDYVTTFESSHDILPGEGPCGTEKGVTFEQVLDSAVEQEQRILYHPTPTIPVITGRCPHCSKNGHTGPQCWLEHPELRPARAKRNSRSAKRRKLNNNGCEPP